jgi:hypothetical protein
MPGKIKILLTVKRPWCLLYSLLFLLLPLSAGAQEAGSCAEKLKNAQSLFDKGQVEQVSSILSECMKSGFNREESLTAYKLLIQSFLFEDKLDQADSTMLEFLKKNPEYQISPTDHSSFVHLFNNFKVKPVVQISFHFGTNFPFLSIMKEMTSSSVPGKSIYSTKAFNLYSSAEAKFRISNKLELNVEAGYSQIKFSNTEEFMGFGKINYSETQTRLELPLSVTYNILSFGKFTTYGRLGSGPALTLGSIAQTSVDPTDINNPIRHTGTDIDRSDSRISMDLLIQAGGGIKFKTRGGYILAEVRSNFGVFNQTVRGGTLAEELRGFYYYVDDDFRINTLNFSLGYTQIFYKPSKRKE